MFNLESTLKCIPELLAGKLTVEQEDDHTFLVEFDSLEITVRLDNTVVVRFKDGNEVISEHTVEVFEDFDSIIRFDEGLKGHITVEFNA